MTPRSRPIRPHQTRVARRRRNRDAKTVATHPSPSLLSNAPAEATAAEAFDQCLTAIDLIDVTCRSLDHREVGQEQAVLRCALRAMWVAHDYLLQLQDESNADDASDV